MNRLGKSVGVIILLLAGLVIFLHATIPHHHHFDSDFANMYSETNSHKTKDNSNRDFHCHSLNIIFAEKVVHKPVKLQETITPNVFAVLVSFIAFPQNILTTPPIFPQNGIPPKYFFSTKLILRGPPQHIMA